MNSRETSGGRYEYSKNESYVSALIDEMIGYNKNDAQYNDYNGMIRSYANYLFLKKIGKENVRKRVMEDYGLSEEELLSVPDIKKFI